MLVTIEPGEDITIQELYLHIDGVEIETSVI